MNRRRPKPDDAALSVAIAHLERDAHIASNNADVALTEKRTTDAQRLEQCRDRLNWVIDLLVWRRMTDAAATAPMEAKADAEALEEAELLTAWRDAAHEQSRKSEAGM